MISILAHPGHIEHDVPIILSSPLVVGLLIALALLLIAGSVALAIYNRRPTRGECVRNDDLSHDR